MLSLLSSRSLKGIDIVDVPSKDKIVHFIFYSVFTGIWFLAFKNRYSSKTSLRLTVFIVAVVYSSLIELCQLLFGWGRDAELLDIVANTIGSAFAVFMLWLFRKKQ